MDVETFAVTSEAGMELYNAAYYAAGQERSVVVGRRRAHPAGLVG